ncbi:unnamed protein product [Closterium sp. NIES-64]|nr:unnamed protein product [Closterium sp. NIES-64]CAI6003607.1 unnamed protein product [Closterium sp. NIES-64]
MFHRFGSVTRGILRERACGRKDAEQYQAKKAAPTMQAKLVLLGDMGAGKSSLVLRFVKGQFFEYQESTIGAAFLTQTVAVSDAVVKFEIWDTAGQERYHSLAPMYYRGAAAAIIVYDITSTDSFARAKKWVQELQRQGNPNLVIALAANKTDLEAQRKVSEEVSVRGKGRGRGTRESGFWMGCSG